MHCKHQIRCPRPMVIQVRWLMHIVTHHLGFPRPARNNKMPQHLSLPRQTLPLRLWKLPVPPAGVDRFSCILYIYRSIEHACHVPLGRWHWHHWIPLHPCRQACQHFHDLANTFFMGLPMHACCGKIINTSLFVPINSTFLKYKHVKQTKISIACNHV